MSKGRKKIVSFQPEESHDPLHDEIQEMFAEMQNANSGIRHKTPNMICGEGIDLVHATDAPDLWKPDWAKRLEKLRAKKTKR